MDWASPGCQNHMETRENGRPMRAGGRAKRHLDAEQVLAGVALDAVCEQAHRNSWYSCAGLLQQECMDWASPGCLTAHGNMRAGSLCERAAGPGGTWTPNRSSQGWRLMLCVSKPTEYHSCAGLLQQESMHGLGQPRVPDSTWEHASGQPV